MPELRSGPTWKAVLQGLCPRCRTGAIFAGPLWRFPKMNARCPVCDLLFEREPGYFMGAMYISYGLALPVMGAFCLLLWRFTEWGWTSVVLVSFLALLPLGPVLALFSRVLWIYLDRKIDPQ